MSGDSTIADSDTLICPPIRRSRLGCWTCRSKTVKKKCDQQRPSCGRCSRLNIICDYSKRLTLAERRREPQSTHFTRIDEMSSEDALSLMTYDDTDLSLSAPTVALRDPTSAACSLTLSSSDHEAIHYFATEVAKSHQVRNSKYSLISVMSKLADKEPMAMEMVIALGLQEMNLRRPFPRTDAKQSSLQRYSSSLRRLADAISHMTVTTNLDAIYTTLWMMLVYEQKFGDSQCTAYIHHLKGISSILQYRSDHPFAVTAGDLDSTTRLFTLHERSQPGKSVLSTYSARLLVWIAHLDAAAASSGFGGHVNTTILEHVQQSNHDSRIPPTESIEAFTRFHRESRPLYRIVWGEDYPQEELLDDIENHDVYALLAACVQLRVQTARLGMSIQEDPVSAVPRATDVGDAIDHVSKSFDELIQLASRLSWQKNISDRLVASLCAVVPIYYAVVLEFTRATNFDQRLTQHQRHAMKEILNLTYHSYKSGGDEAMIKVAWPLFIVAIETDDLLHLDWILERFKMISKYGQNFERAYNFLLEIIPMQQRAGSRVDIYEEMRKRPKFVLA